MLEHKSFPVGEMKVAGGDEGLIEAIVSVFSNVDAAQERVLPGFFAKSLRRKLPKGVWGHDWQSPVAKTLEARELGPGDPKLPSSLKKLGGLYIKGQFNLDTQRGREAFSDIKFGIVDEFSIGYKVDADEVDKKTGVRDLVEGQLFEWSPVLVGMNDQTALISAKAANPPDTDPDAAELKVGRRISRQTESHIRAALDALSALLDAETDAADEDDGKSAEVPLAEAGERLVAGFETFAARVSATADEDLRKDRDALAGFARRLSARQAEVDRALSRLAKADEAGPRELRAQYEELVARLGLPR